MFLQCFSNHLIKRINLFLLIMYLYLDTPLIVECFLENLFETLQDSELLLRCENATMCGKSVCMRLDMKIPANLLKNYIKNYNKKFRKHYK